MFALTFTNIPSNGTRHFETLSEAVRKGKEWGYEFSVRDASGRLVASWTVSGGLNLGHSMSPQGDILCQSLIHDAAGAVVHATKEDLVDAQARIDQSWKGPGKGGGVTPIILTSVALRMTRNQLDDLAWGMTYEGHTTSQKAGDVVILRESMLPYRIISRISPGSGLNHWNIVPLFDGLSFTAWSSEFASNHDLVLFGWGPSGSRSSSQDRGYMDWIRTGIHP